jgi:hypothetical protein
MAIAKATAPAPAAERAAGLADPEDAFLRYAARCSCFRPASMTPT